MRLEIRKGFPVQKKNVTDSKFWQLWMLAGNGIMVNLMFLICSLPIVTMGPAWCGLYSSLRFAIKGGSWASGFKEGISTRFWRMLVAWVVCLGMIIYMSMNIISMLYYKNEGYIPMLIAYSLFLLLAMMITASLILLNVYIPTSVSQWLKNAMTLTFKSPIQTAVGGVLMWVPFAVVLLFDISTFYVLMIFVALYFTVVVLIATMLLKDALIDIKLEMEAMEEALMQAIAEMDAREAQEANKE